MRAYALVHLKVAIGDCRMPASVTEKELEAVIDAVFPIKHFSYCNRRIASMINRRYSNVLTFLVLLAIWLLSGVASAEPAAGSEWSEPATGMKFVWIPSGCFSMGSSAGYKNEQPVHSVCVRGFYLGEFDVTESQYQRVMGINPSYYKGNNLPVQNVSWDDAQRLAAKLSSQFGEAMRLPTEAEWEYACKAGGKHDLFCGDGDPVRLSWYVDNSDGEPHNVGEKFPNAWGLYDMNGNVLEWTQDCWHKNYNEAPNDGSAWNSGNCQLRVMRGGSIVNRPKNIRAAIRFPIVPSFRGGFAGFRLVRK